MNEQKRNKTDETQVPDTGMQMGNEVGVDDVGGEVSTSEMPALPGETNGVGMSVIFRAWLKKQWENLRNAGLLK